MKTLAIVITLLLGFLTTNPEQDFTNKIINDEINETVCVNLDKNGNPGVYPNDRHNEGRGSYSKDGNTFHSGAGDLPVIRPEKDDTIVNRGGGGGGGGGVINTHKPSKPSGGGGASMPSFDWLEEIE